ncbi:CG15925, partial [Drosophila busckii]
MQQLQQLQRCLQTDLLACDARCSLFVAAVHSYRYEQLLQHCLAELQLSIDDIYAVLGSLERLELLAAQLQQGNYGGYEARVYRLLHGLLVQHGERVALSTLQAAEFEPLYAHLQIPKPSCRPTHILEVTPSLKCAHTQAYARLQATHQLRLGFYAVPLQQLYAMLTVGGLPDNGPVRITTDLEEALQLAQLGVAWGASRLGALLRCVAIVEFALVPQLVQVEQDNRHAVISDASCLQISYLLCFGESLAAQPEAPQRQLKQQLQQLLLPLTSPWPKLTERAGALLHWAHGNKYSLTLGVYLMCVCLTPPSGRCGLFHSLASSAAYALRRGFL